MGEARRAKVRGKQYQCLRAQRWPTKLRHAASMSFIGVHPRLSAAPAFTFQRMKQNMTFKTICNLDEIPSLGARRFKREDGKVIAIFRNAEDKVFALQDKCPHKGGPLSQGIVFGESVACPLHNWCIGLNDGCAAAPDIGVVEKFPARVVDGAVELDPWSVARVPMASAAE